MTEQRQRADGNAGFSEIPAAFSASDISLASSSHCR